MRRERAVRDDEKKIDRGTGLPPGVTEEQAYYFLHPDVKPEAKIERDESGEGFYFSMNAPGTPTLHLSRQQLEQMLANFHAAAAKAEREMELRKKGPN
ncbi:MAG: hypothetical protein C5B60_03380 [Chloroflexi bacterium]|nr:MAG: hypothetical protein C5B60_03380 [Chloroflexota bacterium]